MLTLWATGLTLLAMALPRDTYAHGHHDSVLRSHGRRSATNSAGYLLPRLRPTDRLLDVGVGPGTITVDLAERLTEGWVTGVDNAAAAVQSARELAAARAVRNLTLQTGDVSALDFPSGTFDVVHAHQVLQHVSDPVAALREMLRVCRDGGVVAARDADYRAMTWWPTHPGLDRWLELYQRVARAGGGEPDAGRRLRVWARAAGARSVTATADTWCYSEPDDVAWWSQSWAERVTSSAMARHALDLGFADTEELEALSAAWVEWGESPDAWFVVLHGEVLASP